MQQTQQPSPVTPQPVPACESAQLVPTAPASFHQWRCRAGQHAATFISSCKPTACSERRSKWLDNALSHSNAKLAQPKKIMTLFKSGELLARGINFENTTLGSRSRVALELDYQQDLSTPKPGVAIQEGIRTTVFFAELVLGLSPVRPLYCYKKDVSSHWNETKDSHSRLLQPDRLRLLEKLSEKNERIDGLYPPRNSGRMVEDGTHICGHDKQRPDYDCLPINEVIIEGYRTEQYQCVIIAPPFTLDKLYRHLERKALLEKSLFIEELPLVFYQPKCGNILATIYLSDLGIFPDQLPLMKANIERLKLFVERSGSLQLDSLLSLMEPSRLLDFLQYLPVDVVTAIKQLSTPYRNSLLNAAKKADLETVEWCQERGGNLRASYFHNYKHCNLLDFLLESEHLCQWRKSTRTPLQQQKLSDQARLGILLYDQGCKVPVTSELIAKIPSLGIYMLGRGEPYAKTFSSCNPFLALESALSHKIISNDEFQTGITCLTRDFIDEPAELDEFYTRYLVEKPKIGQMLGFPESKLVHGFNEIDV